MVRTQDVAAVLGGAPALQADITGVPALQNVIRLGIPAVALDELVRRLGLSRSEAAHVFGIPERTLTRRLSTRSRLTPTESDRAVRVARIVAAALEYLGDESLAVAWLRDENRALGGARPLEQLDTEIGAREVEDVLGRIAYGVYS
ncbi:MAG: antitoxin Xre/MbcA/ParS toxin-binding domain-containing protein [Candidatus Velthaea sp.]